MRLVSPDEARRIAVRAQALDGSAKGVLATVRRLGSLQIDPIATVAPPQYLVLWSRLGAYDRTTLDRLLWDERKLFEWNAFIWPIEDLPLVKAQMRRRGGAQTRPGSARAGVHEGERGVQAASCCASSSATARCCRASSRTDSAGHAERHRWYGSRRVA